LKRVYTLHHLDFNPTLRSQMAENFFNKLKKRQKASTSTKTVEKAFLEVIGLVVASHMDRSDTVTAFAPVSLSRIARDEYDDLYADVVTTTA
jgi:hypothetical protein